MKNLFVPYEIALLAKNNGFNEGCLAIYDSFDNGLHTWRVNDTLVKPSDIPNSIVAPIYQQLIDWFRIEHDILIWVETATYVNMFNYRYYIETYDNKAEGMKTNNYYEALNDAIKKAFKMIPQISK